MNTTRTSAASSVATFMLVPAARAGLTRLVRHLLAHGADPCTRGRDGRTALDHAREKGRGDVVLELLLARGGVR